MNKEFRQFYHRKYAQYRYLFVDLSTYQSRTKISNLLFDGRDQANRYTNSFKLELIYEN